MYYNLSEYIIESISDHKINKIIEIFMEHIDDLSAIHKQHFLSRLSLCDVPQAKDLSPSTGIEDTLKITKDVCDLYREGKYYDIIKKYVSKSYKNKENIKNWLLSYSEGMPAKYFATGYLSTNLDIIERSGNVDKLDNLEEIYEFYESIEDLIKFHSEDPINCKETCGTLYVNFIGNTYYVLNSASMNFHNKIDISEWRKTREKFYNAKEFTYSSVYGVTHCIINGCHFYTQRLDIQEFKPELDFIARFLQEQKKDNFELKDYITIDVLAEAALCEKLAYSDEYSEWKDTNKHLISLIDNKTEILQSNNRYKNNIIQNLENNEHANILFILLNKYKAI